MQMIAITGGALTLLGSTVGVTTYVNELKEHNTKQDILITQNATAITALQALTTKAVDSVQRQEYYIEYGILPRLQLDKEQILKEAMREQTFATTSGIIGKNENK